MVAVVLSGGLVLIFLFAPALTFAFGLDHETVNPLYYFYVLSSRWRFGDFPPKFESYPIYLPLLQRDSAFLRCKTLAGRSPKNVCTLLVRKVVYY